MSSTDLPYNETFNATLLSGDDRPLSVRVSYTLVAILSFVAVLVVVSNLLIILAFAVESQLRVYTNYYIINMALADTMVGLTAMGLSILQNLLEYVWPFGHISCVLIISISHTSLHVSVLMLVVISIDRWYAVHYPLKHLAQRRKKNALWRNIFVWLTSFLFWALFIGVWGLVDTTLHNTTLCSPLYNRYVLSTFVAAAMYYWIPTTIIGVLYYFIYRKIRASGGHNISKHFKENENIVSHSSASSTSGNQTPISYVSTSDSCLSSTEAINEFNNPIGNDEVLESAESSLSPTNDVTSSELYGDDNVTNHGEMKSRTRQVRNSKQNKKVALENQKAQRTLSLLMIALVLTWTPYATVILASTYCHTVLNKVSGECFPTILLVIGLWCSWGNSLLNPFMYAVAQPLFKTTIINIFLGKWRK